MHDVGHNALLNPALLRNLKLRLLRQDERKGLDSQPMPVGCAQDAVLGRKLLRPLGRPP